MPRGKREQRIAPYEEVELVVGVRCFQIFKRNDGIGGTEEVVFYIAQSQTLIGVIG